MILVGLDWSCLNLISGLNFAIPVCTYSSNGSHKLIPECFKLLFFTNVVSHKACIVRNVFNQITEGQAMSPVGHAFFFKYFFNFILIMVLYIE